VLNHATVISLITDGGGRVVGARVRDNESGAVAAVHARTVVNATGPFTDSVRKMADGSCESIILPSAGARNRKRVQRTAHKRVQRTAHRESIILRSAGAQMLPRAHRVFSVCPLCVQTLCPACTRSLHRAHLRACRGQDDALRAECAFTVCVHSVPCAFTQCRV
jgi:hypothetical protein